MRRCVDFLNLLILFVFVVKVLYLKNLAKTKNTHTISPELGYSRTTKIQLTVQC